MWAVAVGERLACVREKENLHNIYVVSVISNGVVFVNLPVVSFHCSSKRSTYLRIDMIYVFCKVVHMFRLFIVTILAVTILVFGYVGTPLSESLCIRTHKSL